MDLKGKYTKVYKTVDQSIQTDIMVSLFYFRSLIMLNEKQKQALSFIRNYYNDNGKLPTVREVQGEFSYASPRSAQVIINALLNEGFLLR